jgi:hypothetical protein
MTAIPTRCKAPPIDVELRFCCGRPENADISRFERNTAIHALVLGLDDTPQ